MLKSWHNEYQGLSKDRMNDQLTYEAKRDIEELEAAVTQENLINVHSKIFF